MKRRARVGSKASRKRPNPNRGKANAIAHARSSDSDLLKQFDQQARELAEARKLLADERKLLAEALERQTATSEVLSVISRSPGDLLPVFNAMLHNATRICGAELGTMELYREGSFTLVASHGAPSAYLEYRQTNPTIHPKPQSALGKLAAFKTVSHVLDLTAEPEHARGHLASLAGARTLMAVPMLREDELIGAMGIYRQEPRPFAEKQIELVQNFAAQAVIAIENTRLLGELRQRTDDLSESLEQQTATSEVLKVISSSPGELEPVFHAMLENAVRICDAKFGNLLLADGDRFRHHTLSGAPSEWTETIRQHPFTDATGDPRLPLARVMATKGVVQIADLRAEEGYLERVHPIFVALVELAGARTLLLVPMLKDVDLVGVIGIFRQEVRPFSDKQIELMQNFAAQAVIAIENARLLSELRESLQQQTATADVLKVISRSTFDLQTVLDTLVESAARLCRADTASVRIAKDGVYHSLADFGFQPQHRQQIRNTPMKVDRASLVGRVALERRPVHLLDAQADPDPGLAARSRSGNTRTMLGVPLLREGNPIGVLLLQRHTVEAFTDKQIELIQTFADQAVIAIENVRLFDEIQDKSRQLAEASQHKSQFLASMSHELRTPLNAILGYTELIADGIYGAPPEKMQTVLKRVESNGRHLLGLINAVLDLSKIEAGQLTLDLADYSLQNVAQTVYNAVEPLAVDKKLAFKADIQPDLPSGRGDERRLTQVLLNLVGNAIKFTDAGEVVIKVGTGNGSFELAVSDTGPGISAADQAKLFQEFKQADNPKTRKKEGTGLGLAISKRIVEMHGGRIWIESQLGQGSTFFVTLPVQVKEQAKPN